MPYTGDITTEIDLDGYEAPATFSTYVSDAHPDDLPSLTLESVRLGNHIMNREAVIDWIGPAEVARIEAACQPDDWDLAERSACERADAWRRENAA